MPKTIKKIQILKSEVIIKRKLKEFNNLKLNLI